MNKPQRIETVAASLGLSSGDVEPVGWFKGKLALGLETRLADRPLGKYIDVTAVSPTPLGEGKTVVSIGLAMALSKLGKKAIATIREPSLAPVFGIKGGGAGGGQSTLLPTEEINLHFTGDMHAVTAANNLLAAMIDNHIKRGKTHRLDPEAVTWKRCIDMSDRGLEQIVTGLGNVPQAPERRTGFDLTAASEVMAILALATSFQDLRERLGRIVVGSSVDGDPVTAEDLQAAGAMAALLRDAIRPNLVQTCEGTPALVHSGPFGNIAHGNCSILSDLAAIRLADYVVTESGFGSDCGAEKFFNIKCRASGLKPDAQVLVATVRALKYQSGRFDVRPGRPLPEALFAEDLEALRAGACNLEGHISIVKQFGLPIVVAINRFSSDTDRELEEVKRIALECGAMAAVVTEAFSKGSAGTMELAEAVMAACEEPSAFEFLYSLDATPEEKIEILATKLYGADGVDFEPAAREQMQRYVDWGYGDLPVCVAKTQYSLSHDAKLLGRPSEFRFPIREVHLSAGAGFLYALSGKIRTMPGLPTTPAATRIDVDEAGGITGM